MKRLAFSAFGLALLAALAALVVLVLAQTDWLEDYSGLTLFLAAVAAVSGVAGVIITWLGGSASARHLQALAEQQEQAAYDIRRLAELTESSLEEARAQKPEPVIQFVVEKARISTGSAIWTRKPFAREINVDQIVEEERRAALAPLPPPEPTVAEQRASETLAKLERQGAGKPPAIAGLANIASLISSLGLHGGPISGEEQGLHTAR